MSHLMKREPVQQSPSLEVPDDNIRREAHRSDLAASNIASALAHSNAGYLIAVSLEELLAVGIAFAAEYHGRPERINEGVVVSQDIKASLDSSAKANHRGKRYRGRHCP